ncbi:DUF4349 domain-containing protein [Candidatus Leptofilum sp.]|uniref:DUF4349 domain-containing protein n=1 Tax=Candidatus Leptofilum sp. TaxID=3241576 RepID=UPI003B5B0B08
MNAKRFYWLAALATLLLALVACGGGDEPFGSPAQVVEVTRVITEAIAEDADVAVEGSDPAVQSQTRLIIKNGELAIMVVDVDTAVATTTQLVADLGGYIISQQIFDVQTGYSAANMQLAVPVTQFENTLTQLRQLGDVTNDFAGGQDVTDEFVDLGSRLDNLIVTRDRLRSFLDDAETVEEALRINDELKVVEEEIAIIQGRRNYLSDRAAFSTIDLALEPILPTPTPSPIPTPASWQPGDTAQVALVNLQESAQQTADFSIYYGIVCGPWLLLLAALGWIGWRLQRRFGWWQ